MVMENPFEGKEIWFGVGSQDLYGEEALRQVAIHSAEMVDYLNNTGKIPAKIVLKPTLKSSDGVKEFMVEASANPNVIGVITWCHTFSPAKMWIRGLEVLTKPLLQLATQHHKEIPWETIDMDFMNLNQAAHGDREFGYIVSRLGIPRKIVVGHYTDPEVAEKVGTWARACAGWDASNNMKVMRWGDNMRNVAVTEGDTNDYYVEITGSDLNEGDVIRATADLTQGIESGTSDSDVQMMENGDLYVGDGSNMANSLIVGGLLSGMKVDCVCPHGYRPAADVLMFAHKYGSAFRLLEDPAEGVKDADVVVTAVWNTAAPGTSESESRLRDFAGFQLTSSLLKAAKPDCMVLHCLPAHRGEEISTAVFEAHADEIFTEAENRLHVQKAVLAVLLAGK